MSEQEALFARARESLRAARILIKYGVEQNVSSSETSQIVDWADEFLAVAETYLKS